MSDEYELKPLDEHVRSVSGQGNPGEPAAPAGAAPAGGTPAASGTPAAAGPGLPPGFVPPVPVIEPPDPEPVDPDAEDRKKHQGMAILAYLLFLIPLIAAPQSKFARYHANQGLLVFIVGMGVVVAVMIITVLVVLVFPFLSDHHLGILSFFGYLVCYPLMIAMCLMVLALAVMGIINAANGEAKPLPLIGHYTLIK